MQYSPVRVDREILSRPLFFFLGCVCGGGELKTTIESSHGLGGNKIQSLHFFGIIRIELLKKKKNIWDLFQIELAKNELLAIMVIISIIGFCNGQITKLSCFNVQ